MMLPGGPTLPAPRIGSKSTVSLPLTSQLRRRAGEPLAERLPGAERSAAMVSGGGVVVGGDGGTIDASPVRVGLAEGTLEVGPCGDTLVGASVFLELAEGDVEGEEGILPGLRRLLAVSGDVGFYPSERGKSHEDQHEKGDERDSDQQREATARTECGEVGAMEGVHGAMRAVLRTGEWREEDENMN